MDEAPASSRNNAPHVQFLDQITHEWLCPTYRNAVPMEIRIFDNRWNIEPLNKYRMRLQNSSMLPCPAAN
jgi:hypothetical protein